MFIVILAILFSGVLSAEQRRRLTIPYSCEPIDLMFVVDGSGSVGAEGFEKVKAWLNITCRNIMSSMGDQVQIGILEYSNDGSSTGFKVFEIPFRLGECATVDCMTSKIRNMQHLGGLTYTANALNHVLEVEFPSSPRAGNSSKIIVLITDGLAMDGDKLAAWYKRSVEQSITTFAVGIGQYSEKQLRTVANGDTSNKRVLKAEKVSALPAIIASLTKSFCEDVDECEIASDLCNTNATCANSFGTYSCMCPAGYTGDGEVQCRDLDECKEDVHSCHDHATCRNTIGSYECFCAVGYSGDGYEDCEDVDECMDAKDPCNSYAICANSVGNYSCMCLAGYTGDGVVECTDLDECEEGGNNCHDHATCDNTFGSYECFCAVGYKGDGYEDCEDLNECDLQTDRCSEHAYCFNTLGSHECVCKSGYTGDGESCIDIDECTEDTHNCTIKPVCSNFAGGFSCGCEEGELEEAEFCSVCSCLPKAGYDSPASSCSADGIFNCEYMQKGLGTTATSCTVPSTQAFGAVFSAIQHWQDSVAYIKSKEEVVEQVLGIDNAIKCAAIATVSSDSFTQNSGGVEASSSSMTREDSSNGAMVDMPRFSESGVRKISMPTDGNITAGRVVALQFFAPKACVDLLLAENLEAQLEKTIQVFTGTIPLLSVSLFDSKTFQYQHNSGVELSINVQRDINDFEYPGENTTDPNGGAKYVKDVKYVCTSINTSSGRLSESGCTSSYSPRSHVTCRCVHTTMFAILLSVTEVTVPRGVKIATYFTEIPSVLLLALTAVILLNVRPQIRGDRVGVQICLTFSLLFLHVFNLLHDAAFLTERTCETLAILIHYFLLASAMWMLMEGITLVAKTNDHVLQYLNEGNNKKLAMARHFISWGVPFLIVLVSATVGLLSGTYVRLNPFYLDGYRDMEVSDIRNDKYTQCLLQTNILIWSVLLPISIVMILNIVIIVRMAYVVYKMSSDEDNFKPTGSVRGDYRKINHARAAFKAFLVLLPVLGITWILAFLTNIDYRDSSLYFMYGSAILNGLQGVFLFIVYCVIGKEVRKAVEKKYRRMEYRRNSTLDSSRKHSSNWKAQLKSPDKTKETLDKNTGGGMCRDQNISPNQCNRNVDLTTKF